MKAIVRREKILIIMMPVENKTKIKKGKMFFKNILWNVKYQNEMLKLAVKNSYA